MLIENIFISLIKNSDYFRICFPFLKEEYFQERDEKLLFKKISKHYITHNKIPTIADLRLVVESDYDISLKDTEAINTKLTSLKKVEVIDDNDLMVKETEKWVKDRAIEKATQEFVDSLEKDDGSRGQKLEDIKAALGIEFIVNLGHDYFDKKSLSERLESYAEEDTKIPLDIENINVALGGGLVKKSIACILGSTNSGKTTWLVHMAASLIRSGKNVGILSGEMSVKAYHSRIDANILDTPIQDFKANMDVDKYKSKFKSLLKQTHGELLIKYFRAGSMNALHIRNWLQEIKLKKGFIPDVLILDHLTLFGSTRLPASRTGEHIYVTCVVEEIRDIAVEFDCCILTGVQLNRGAKAKKQDISNEDVGLGYGISQVSDVSLGLILTAELREQNKYLCRVLKTRFASNNEQIYGVGVDFDRMKLLNLDESEEVVPLHIRDKIKVQQEKADKQEEKLLFDFN